MSMSMFVKKRTQRLTGEKYGLRFIDYNVNKMFTFRISETVGQNIA